MTTTTATLAPHTRIAFVTAGHAKVTLESSTTGARFTYQVDAPSSGGTRDFAATIRFVSVLTGPNNCADFGYIGFLKLDHTGTWRFVHGGAKARAGAQAPSVRAFGWFASHADDDRVNVHHAGSCGRCGRALTVPESIESGLGPVCAEKIAA